MAFAVDEDLVVVWVTLISVIFWPLRLRRSHRWCCSAVKRVAVLTRSLRFSWPILTMWKWTWLEVKQIV